VSVIPGEIANPAGPVRQAADIYLEGLGNTGVIIAENILETPTRPGTTTPAQWGSATWGDTYAMLPVLNGTQHVLSLNNRAPTTYGPGVVPLHRSGYNGLDLGLPANSRFISLFPSDGVWGSGTYMEIGAQITPTDAAGRQAIRFTRGTAGDGETHFWAAKASGTLTDRFQVLGESDAVNVAGTYRVNGTQVVGQRLPAVAKVTGTAGATYTATERALINGLITAVNTLIARLSDADGGHGLIA
jgi:hypothetical protein